MSHHGKQEYLRAIWGRYQRVGRRFKSKILDEFCAVCGYARKYAIRLLNRPLPRAPRRPGPKVKYEGKVVQVLKAIWKLSEWMCSKRLKEALPLWMPYYERHRGPLDLPTRRLLLRMSPATIDRVLRSARARAVGWGRCGTRAALKLKLKIPIPAGHPPGRAAGLAGDGHGGSLWRPLGRGLRLEPHGYRLAHAVDGEPGHLEQGGR